MKLIGVIGGSTVNRKIYEHARTVGNEIARRGDVVVCGGLSGVMEAACKGAKEAGGLTIGILPSSWAKDANKYVDIAIPTGIGEARNVVIINTAVGFIAVDGREGTLSEIAFALKRKKPVVGINTYDLPGIVKENDPVKAVKKLYELMGEK
ncbi:MAG: TIGR00725 family protein [Candidatus Goldbacteria bacterium]|nr:TIGR00725 family protein [Candidatus Goldiibacteriota bacterium]HPD18293.1 TIGR00725 family protein [Candidatus Goldiibacteriota bacterium]